MFSGVRSSRKNRAVNSSHSQLVLRDELVMWRVDWQPTYEFDLNLDRIKVNHRAQYLGQRAFF